MELFVGYKEVDAYVIIKDEGLDGKEDRKQQMFDSNFHQQIPCHIGNGKHLVPKEFVSKSRVSLLGLLNRSNHLSPR